MNKVLQGGCGGHHLFKQLNIFTIYVEVFLRASLLFFVVSYANAEMSVDISASIALGAESNSGFIVSTVDYQNFVPQCYLV